MSDLDRGRRKYGAVAKAVRRINQSCPLQIAAIACKFKRKERKEKK